MYNITILHRGPTDVSMLAYRNLNVKYGQVLERDNPNKIVSYLIKSKFAEKVILRSFEVAIIFLDLKFCFSPNPIICLFVWIKILLTIEPIYLSILGKLHKGIICFR